MSATRKIVSWVFVEGIGLFARTTFRAESGKVSAAQFMAWRTHNGALVQPAIGCDANGQFLTRKGAFVAVVAHQNV